MSYRIALRNVHEHTWMHLTPTTFKCLHFPSFKNSWHYVYMPKTILSHGISPILYALGNEELEHIQYKQIHSIKQAQNGWNF